MNDLTSSNDNSPAVEEDNFERIDRFQAMEPGTFWRARRDVVQKREESRSSSLEGIADEGDVLLLTAIDMYDGAPHTIKLLDPPSRGGHYTHNMLVNDFLDAFEYEPDGEAIRRQQLLETQERIGTLQKELLEGTSTRPELMEDHINKGLLEWREKKVRSGEMSDKTAIATTSLQGASLRTDIGFAIENQIKPTDVQQIVLFAEEKGEIAKLQGEWITSKTRDISLFIERRLTPFFKEQAAVALAKTSQIMDFAKEIEKGIRSLNLYTGVDVEVESIATGEEAPSSEPLTLMQAKLFADEELALHEDVSERFDHFDEKRFISALAANPAFRDQLLPFPRCVVSMAVRRRDLNYEGVNSKTEAQWNRMNKHVFLLVRNGENIHRVWSGTPSHEFTPRLFPTKTEGGDIFRGIDGRHINFRDIDFTDKNRNFDDHALHYKRFLILLCGLDHRLNLFGSFYHEPKGLNFISMEFQTRNLRFVADDEPGTLLAEDRPPVWAWMEAQNKHLQSGSRVLCHLSALIDTETAPSCQKTGSHGFLEVYAKPVEESGVFVVIKDGKDLVVKVPVERKRNHNLIQKGFDARVSLTAYDQEITEKAGFGFLCLDAAQAEDLRWYINNRHSRIGHAYFLRLFRRVLKTLELEEQEEAASRTYLRDAALQAGVGTPETIDDLVSEAVRRWRRAYRGAALPRIENGAKELTPLLTQIHSLNEDNHLTSLTRMQSFAARAGLTPLRAVITGKNKWVLYAEVPKAERLELFDAWGWVWRIRLNPTKSGASEAGRTMVWLMDQPTMSERTIHEWPECASWVHPVTADTPTLPAKQQEAMKEIMALANTLPATYEQLAREGIDPEQFSALLARYREVRTENMTPRGDIPEVKFHVGIGFWEKNGTVGTIVIAMSVPHFVRRFGTPDQKTTFLKQHLDYVRCRNSSKRYSYGSARKQMEIEFFTRKNAPFKPALLRTLSLDIHEMPFGSMMSLNHFRSEDMARASRHPGTYDDRFFYTEGPERSLNEQLEYWLANEVGAEKTGVHHAWIAPAYWDGKRARLEEIFRADKPVAKDADGSIAIIE